MSMLMHHVGVEWLRAVLERVGLAPVVVQPLDAARALLASSFDADGRPSIPRLDVNANPFAGIVETPREAAPSPAITIGPSPQPAYKGALVINADDWGCDAETTNKTLDCIRIGTVSAVSAMVFMEDSERAATLAANHIVDAGLHLNFTSAFTASKVPPQLLEQQRRVSAYLRRHRFAQTIFHPGLSASFEYVAAAQIDEFRRLYGSDPTRLDGHHHMHLAANVLRSDLMPANTLVRRNFYFRPGEKGLFNRLYRRSVDRRLSRRHRLVDYLFSLPPIDHPRLQRIFSLAHDAIVELETHPVVPEEYRFLAEGEIYREIGDLPIARGFPASVRAGQGKGPA